MNDALMVKHLRKMVELAYFEVERIREEKAKLEGVPYVPGQKPTDIDDLGSALFHIENQRKEKSQLDHWFQSSETGVAYAAYEELAKALEPFGVEFHVNRHAGHPDGEVLISKRARIIHKIERETYGG